MTSPIFVPRRRGLFAGLRQSVAYTGFRLRFVTPIAVRERLSRQMQLLAGLRVARDGSPGARYAVDLRYVVTPDFCGLPRIECYLIGRVSALDHNRAHLKRLALDWHDQMYAALESALFDYCTFEPLYTPQQIPLALQPFPVADTVELRHQILPTSYAPLPVPFAGTPRPEFILGAMLREKHPTMYSIYFEHIPRLPLPLAQHASVREMLTRRTIHGDGAEMCAVDPVVPGMLRQIEALMVEELLLRRVIALDQMALRMCVRLGGQGRLSRALLTAVGNEVGGLGIQTDEFARHDAGIPGFGQAICVTPLSPSRLGEFAVARANLARIEADPWGVDAISPGLLDLHLLANLHEAASMCALPIVWLP